MAARRSESRLEHSSNSSCRKLVALLVAPSRLSSFCFRSCSTLNTIMVSP